MRSPLLENCHTPSPFTLFVCRNATIERVKSTDRPVRIDRAQAFSKDFLHSCVGHHISEYI
ncbi:hypothetical protein H6F67_15625 [Microcoleus sp. FACHB-1515]|uniref:hypothetical protein n=1 Tax=Cyanophyceae TaxID=3028117 RepID=UPI001686979C|nr:hypothetical protein [Microcoleus sp. FACHB-1515]MBD2091285.1 hypothetical protein [Microcoleus sp. FACHB-1515]